MAGDRSPATGTPTTSASTAPGSPASTPPRRPGAGRLTCASRSPAPAGGWGGRSSRRSTRRRSPARRRRSPGPAPTSTSTRPGGIARLLDRDRPEVVVHAPPGPTSTAAPATRSSPCRATATRRRPRRGDAPRAASTSSSSRRTRSSTAGGPTAAATRPTTPTEPDQPVRRVASSPASWPRATAYRARAPAATLAIVRTAWLFGPPGKRLPGEDPRRRRAGARGRRAAAGRRRRVGHADVRQRRRRGDRGAARRGRRSRGIHHLVNGASRRVRTGPATSLAPRPGSRSPIEEVPAVDVAAARRRRRLGRARADAAARRRAAAGRGRTRWPTTPRHSCGDRRGTAAGAMTGGRDGWPRPSACPASATGGGPARRRRGSFRELWRASAVGAIPDLAAPARPGRPAGRDPRFVQANLSSVGGRACCAGSTIHRRQLDYWVGPAGRAFVALVDVRPVLGGRRGRSWRPGRAGGRRLGRDPDRRRPRVPRAGALELLYLVTNEYDGSDELGFAWDDPAVARAVARRLRGSPTAGRSCPSATAEPLARRAPDAASELTVGYDAAPARLLQARPRPYATGRFEQGT